MKKIILLFISVFCFLLISPAVFAANEENRYESDAITSFYGKYEYPKDDEKPAASKNKDIAAAKVTKLPQTGDVSYQNVHAIGISMLLLAASLLVIHISHIKKEEKGVLK